MSDAKPRRGAALSRARIAREAISMFGDRGVDRTTMRDLASKLGVTEPALYRHYASKDDLYGSVFLEAYGRLASDIVEICENEPRFRARIRAVVEHFAATFDRDRQLFQFLLFDQHKHIGVAPSEPRSNVVAAVRDILVCAMAAGDVPDANPDLRAAAAIGIVVQTAVFLLYGRLSGPLSGYVDDMTAAALAAIGSRPVD